jgi:hypothetical protein
MNTTDWTDRLSEYIDGTLTPAEQAACEAWLSQSAEGRLLLEELRRVVAAAKGMPEAAVPESVWAGISAGIGERTLGRSDVVSIAARAADRPLSVARPRRWSVGPMQFAAAAALFLSVGAGIGLTYRPKGQPGGSVSVSTGVVLTPASNTITPRADVTYDRAIADLQVILDHNRANLDTATVRVLESSLARIDKAIADAQTALAADPSSAYLNDHLSRIKRKKLDLLRQGTSLARAS